MNGLTRNDMKWVTRDCLLRATVPQILDVIKAYQKELEFRISGEDCNEQDSEDNTF